MVAAWLGEESSKSAPPARVNYGYEGEEGGG